MSLTFFPTKSTEKTKTKQLPLHKNIEKHSPRVIAFRDELS